MIYYFAYGSNMDLKRVDGIGLKLDSIRASKLHGWKLVFNVIDNKSDGTGYANIVPDKNSIVEGLIYETDQISMKKLDYLEGYPRYYLKKKVVAVNDDGKPVECITYVGNQKMLERGLKPLRIYMKHLLSGKMFLSRGYLNKLKSVKTIKSIGEKRENT